MKIQTRAAIGLLALWAGSLSAPAAPDGAFVGALAGAGTGLVLGNNVHGVHREWAVPLLAITGGIIGNRFEHRWREQPYPYCNYIYVQAPPNTPPPAPMADLQPGVDLIKVSIQNSNGVRTDVNILRIKDRFIGPRGETYETLPTSEMLAKKYGM